MFFKAKNMLYRLGHKQPILKSIYSFLNAIRKFIMTPLDDVNFAKVYYWYQTGRTLNLNNPSTFDEKVWWLKINYRDPLMVNCSDKYLVRDYVRSCGGEEILNELYGVYNNPFDIDYDLLPNTFFLKTNNGSGGNILCENKDTFDAPSANKKLASYLKNNLYLESREWVYKEIEPKIIAEKVLVPNDSILIDYRFFCTYGGCKFIFVDIDTCARDGSHNPDAKRNVYDCDFNLIPISVTRDNFPHDLIEKPSAFTKMKEWAEKLAKPFPFVRVDLYYVNDHIYFGEMTFFHTGGTTRIKPPEWAHVLGQNILLPTL